MAEPDDAALAELYFRYGSVAFGLAVRVLRDRPLAEEAVQEGFLAIWRSVARFVPGRVRARLRDLLQQAVPEEEEWDRTRSTT